MPRSRIPSPARSQGVISTPRRHKFRGSRSVCSPTPSTGSGRLTSIIDQFKEKNFDSFALSPVNARKSVLTDNTDIEEPRRKSWWKNLNENSRDVMEALVDNKAAEAVNAIEDIVDVEILSQEKKNYTLDLPESSDNESINSIVIPQRKLFSLKENQQQKKFGQLVGARETLAKLHKTHNDKTINAGTKDLFQATKRSKPVFPAALLNISPNKTTADKTKENEAAESKAPVRNIFGSRPANKRKNIFADFIVSESEDEISDIQPKVFGFQNKGDQQKIGSLGKGRDNSPTSSITTDIEMDEWKHLPSSTMVEHQLDEIVAGTPTKRARLSKLSEVKESEAGTYYTTVDKSRLNITSPKDVSNKITIKHTTINDNNDINDNDENNMILVYEGDEELLEEKNVDNAQNKNTSRVQNNVTIIDKTKTKIVDKTNVLDNEHNDTQHMNKTNLNKSVGKLNANESKINKSQKSILANKTYHLEKPEEHGPLEEKVEDVIETETKSNNAVNLSKQIQEHHSIFNEELEKNELPAEDQEMEVKQSGDHEMADIEPKDNKIIESVENKKELNKSNSVKTYETKADSNQNMETDKIQPVQDVASETKFTENENKNINEAEGNKKTVDAFASKINKSDRSKLADKTKNLEESNKQDHVEERVEDVIQTETNKSQVNESRQVKETRNKQDKEQKVSGVQTEKSQEMEAEKHEDEEMTEINEGSDKVAETEDDNDDQRDGENESHLDESLEAEADSSKKMETDKSQSVQEDENEEESDNNEEDDEENVTLQENDEINEGKEQEPNQTQDEVEQSEQIENGESEEIEFGESEEIENGESEEIENDEIEDDEAEKSQDIEAEQSEDEKMSEIDEEHNEVSESEEGDNDDEREEQNESHLDESLEGEADSSKRMETDKGESVQENESEEEESDNNEEDAEENVSLQEDDEVNECQEQENKDEVNKSKESGNRPSLAPPRDSLGLSDGTKDSSAEGSGWDSHRTTRKTLRQTFGKDFTPRKSLRALVMEKAAKHTAHIETLNNDTVKFPQANSTEYPEVSNREENVTMESDHDLSRRTRQTTLETYLQKIKQQNMEKRMKMEEAIRNSLKAPPPRDPLSLFKMPSKPVRKMKTVTNKPKKTIPNIFQGELPPEVVEDMKYKPPKRFQPSQASWITKRLYKYLERKLEPKYDYKARVRAEKLVETIFYFVKELRRHKVASPDAVEVLKHEMARLDIVKTHFEFYEFFHEFMPREVIVKVNPDIVNNIALPRHGVFSDIIRGNNG